MDQDSSSAKRLNRLQQHNARLAKELADAHKRISRLRFERSLLLDKLYEWERKDGHDQPETSDSEGEFRDREWWKDVDVVGVLSRNPVSSLPQPTVRKTPKKRKAQSASTDDDMDDGDMAAHEEHSFQQQLFEFDAPPSMAGSSPPKKRRSNKSSATDAVLKTLAVEYDASGQPALPLVIGVVTIEALGEIAWDRPAYHNRRYILPVGFHSTRPYLSTVDPNSSTIYHSRILDGGNAPIFQVTADDAPGAVFQAPTSTGAWTAVVRQANQLRSRDISNSASGPDYYGLSNATVSMLIEDLPCSERCLNYQRKKFERGAVHAKKQSLLKSEVVADVESDQVSGFPSESGIEYEAAGTLANL